MWQASTVDEELIVFFDGDCLLCEGVVKWLNRMDDNDRLKFAPLQGETAKRYGIDLSDDSMAFAECGDCLLYTSPSPRDRTRSRMPSSA